MYTRSRGRVEGGKLSEEEEEEKFGGDQVRQFRATAARCNYLSIVRLDIMFSFKESCREMSRPVASSWKEVAQNFFEQTSISFAVDLQYAPGVQDVYGDANWVPCTRRRKTTSGGTAMVGSH